MVQNTGTPLRLGAYKSVNLPEPIKVREDAAGLPLEVLTPRRQIIISVEDRWRIDDEWWRHEPLSRMYYAVLFKSGQNLVIYKDLIQNEWHRQVYG
ncbi:MAG TPA: hypothetical protein VLH15_12095 [Dehalococcoidales bacterium]|nr:hypothetical protein [Dehalococcoidales bacterium]